jgi:hypothetical protein
MMRALFAILVAVIAAALWEAGAVESSSVSAHVIESWERRIDIMKSRSHRGSSSLSSATTMNLQERFPSPKAKASKFLSMTYYANRGCSGDALDLYVFPLDVCIPFQVTSSNGDSTANFSVMKVNADGDIKVFGYSDRKCMKPMRSAMQTWGSLTTSCEWGWNEVAVTTKMPAHAMGLTYKEYIDKDCHGNHVTYVSYSGVCIDGFDVDDYSYSYYGSDSNAEMIDCYAAENIIFNGPTCDFSEPYSTVSFGDSPSYGGKCQASGRVHFSMKCGGY